jgi:serine/threonine protein kinase/Tol biopolymer transport system component
MGEVFRARDSRLDRVVAIKILSPTFTADADRLRRFEQEARTIAALNHPNILAIYDIGTHAGTPYLVSEYLDGETLRAKMAAGPIPARRATEYALAVARGLAAAHEKGVVHRDLKPENIFVTRDGQVKILDFGLAKLARPEFSAGTEATMASAATLPGMVLGTVGYMSPEQVRGEPSDARSDIFSFGVVLYEMLTGRPAFKRGSSAESMAAILKEEPAELSASGWHGPPGLERVVARCLEKDPARRFQSASDLAFAIESVTGSSTIVTMPPRPPRRPWRAWAAVGAALLALGGAAGWFLMRPARPSLPKFTRLTYQRGFLANARFAKDGQTVLYSAQWDNDPMLVYSVRREFPQSLKVDLPSASLLALSSTGDVTLMEKPDYHSNFLTGTMAESPMSGGSPRALQNNVIAADYAPDGKSLALSREVPGGKVRLEFPAGKVLYESSGYLDYVRVSPQGDAVAFIEHPVFDDDRGWVSYIDAAGRHQQLTREYESMQGLVWAPAGKEIWFGGTDAGSDLQLLAVTLTGKSRPLLSAPQRLRILDVTADGAVLVSSEQHRDEITEIEPGTGKERSGLEWFDNSGLADISPDGKAILFAEYGAVGGPLYLVAYRKLDGSPPVALGQGGRPRLSPDGKMAAAILVTLPPKIVLHPIDMGDSRELPVGDLASVAYIAWFPDGKRLLLDGASKGAARRSYTLDLEGGKPQPIGPDGWHGLVIAKDGKRIAGYGASGEVVVLDTDTGKTETAAGLEPQDTLLKWTADGRNLLVSAEAPGQTRVYRVDVGTGKRTLVRTLEVADKAGLSDLHPTIADDDQAYFYSVSRENCILYLVEGLR